MDKMHEIKMRLCEELDQYAQKSVTRSDLDTIHVLTDTIKNIMKIEGMKTDGYSMDGGWEARGRYSRDGYPMMSRESYGMGHSYGDMGHSYGDDYANADRRGMHYVRGHYSRAEGKRQILEDIEELMRHENELTATERSALERARNVLK